MLLIASQRPAGRLPHRARDGVVQRVEAVGAARGVSFDVPENTTVALVGESGSGKSVTAMSILQPAARQRRARAAAIPFQGRDLLAAAPAELQRLRGREIACVFQDPMSSLNPVFTVGEQIAEPLRQHLGLSAAAALAARRGAAGRGRHPRAERAARRLSARALRRPAAARDDRDGARLRAQAADRRRADHRARRHHAAPDPRAARAAEGERTA